MPLEVIVEPHTDGGGTASVTIVCFFFCSLSHHMYSNQGEPSDGE